MATNLLIKYCRFKTVRNNHAQLAKKDYFKKNI